MKNLHAGRGSLAALIFVTALFLLVSPGRSLAQRGGPGATAAGRRIDTLNRQSEQYGRDNPAGREQAGPADAAGRRRAQELAQQVKRDFEGLQAAHNQIVLALASRKTPDLDSMLDSVGEARKCAARLKDNLALPRAKDDEGREASSAADGVGDAGMKESLLLLRKHIYNFVTNPTFEAAAVIDVEQALKAGRDLDMILELSESIKTKSGRPK